MKNRIYNFRIMILLSSYIKYVYQNNAEHGVARFVKAMRYKTGRSQVDIFHWYHPSGRTLRQESTQPPTEMSTRNIFWGVNPAGAYSVAFSSVDSLGIWVPQTPGTLSACQGTYRNCFSLSKNRKCSHNECLKLPSNISIVIRQEI
jgi:hypothetical protein